MAPSTQRVYHEPSPPSSPSVDEMDEEEEFVVVDDDIHGRWDGDQRAYIHPTRAKSAVLTVKHTWEHLSVEKVKDTIGVAAAAVALTLGDLDIEAVPTKIGAVANDLTFAASKLAQKTASMVPAAPESELAGKSVEAAIGWQPEVNAFNMGTEESRRRFMWNDAKAEAFLEDDLASAMEELQSDGIPHEQLGESTGLRGIEKIKKAGPKYMEDQNQYDVLGVSDEWRRPVGDIGKERRKAQAYWGAKQEEGQHDGASKRVKTRSSHNPVAIQTKGDVEVKSRVVTQTLPGGDLQKEDSSDGKVGPITAMLKAKGYGKTTGGHKKLTGDKA